MSEIIVGSNKRSYKIRIPYFKELHKKIKSMKGTVWDKESNLWTVPKEESTINDIRQLLLSFGVIKKKQSLNESYYLSDLKKLINELRIQGYSNKTIKVYAGHLRRFMEYYPEYNTFNEAHIKKYILHLKEKISCSHSYISQLIGSLKFWYIKVKRLPDFEFNIVHPRKEKKLPNVLSKKEIQSIISVIQNLKHKIIIMLTYSAGLRVSEVAQLKVSDINSQRGLIKVYQGKVF